MTTDDILKELYDQTLVGNAPAVLELTQRGLDAAMDPETLLFESLIPALEEVGARFERGDFFVPEMLRPFTTAFGAAPNSSPTMFARVSRTKPSAANRSLVLSAPDPGVLVYCS